MRPIMVLRPIERRIMTLITRLVVRLVTTLNLCMSLIMKLIMRLIIMTYIMTAYQETLYSLRLLQCVVRVRGVARKEFVVG